MRKKIADLLWSTKTRKTWTIIVAVLSFLSLLSYFLPPEFRVPPPHVALSGEPIFSDGPAWLTNSFLTTIIVDIVLLVLALLTRFSLKQVPGGLANFMEFVVESMYGLSESVAGKNASRFFPWAMSIFLFVILCNWSGLIPGVGSIGVYQPYHEKGGPAEEILVPATEMAKETPEQVAETVAVIEKELHFVPLFRAPSADLNMTFALAISTMLMVQVWGVRFLGGSYFRKFFTFSGPNIFMKGINCFVGILELISEFARIIAFGFRLFGNIFAGEIVLATMAFLFAFLLPVPFYGLEVFIGFVQALVFMMLSLVFFQMATVGHGGHDDHH